MGVKMRSVGGQHDMADPGLDPHALQTLRVTADMMHGDAGHDLPFAIMKSGPAAEDFAHHGDDIVDLERQPQCLMAHAASGGIGHFAILQVIPRLWKQIMIAAMVVMHMTDDDGLDLFPARYRARQARHAPA